MGTGCCIVKARHAALCCVVLCCAMLYCTVLYCNVLCQGVLPYLHFQLDGLPSNASAQLAVQECGQVQ